LLRVTFDTNVLVRLAVADERAQLAAARGMLAEAELIAIPLVALCETVWTLRRVYRREVAEIADFLSSFLADDRIRTDFATVEAGLDQLRKGGDFADAVIASDGRRLGAETFATFDKAAAKLLGAGSGPVTLLG